MSNEPLSRPELITVVIGDNQLMGLFTDHPSDYEKRYWPRYRQRCAGAISTILAAIEPDGPLRQVVATAEGVAIRADPRQLPPGGPLLLPRAQAMARNYDVAERHEEDADRARTYMAARGSDPSTLYRVYHCTGESWAEGAARFARSVLGEQAMVSVAHMSAEDQKLGTVLTFGDRGILMAEGGYLVQEGENDLRWVTAKEFACYWMVPVLDDSPEWLSVESRDFPDVGRFNAIRCHGPSWIDQVRHFLSKCADPETVGLDRTALLFLDSDDPETFGNRVELSEGDYLVAHPYGQSDPVEVLSPGDFAVKYRVVHP